MPLSHQRSLVVSLISNGGGGEIIITNLGDDLLCDMHCLFLHLAITAPNSCNNPELPTVFPVSLQLSNCFVYTIGSFNPSNNPVRHVCACACVCVCCSVVSDSL